MSFLHNVSGTHTTLDGNKKVEAEKTHRIITTNPSKISVIRRMKYENLQHGEEPGDYMVKKRTNLV